MPAARKQGRQGADSRILRQIRPLAAGATLTSGMSTPATTWLPPVPPGDEQPPHAPAPKTGLRKALGPLFGVLVVIAKFAAKLKAVLLLLPKLKLLTTSASMLVSIAAYALIWGWQFAVGFVALLFVHEMGHVIQMRREGVPISGMLFIPFLGAAVGARSMGGNALAEARIGLAGPVLGTLGAAALIPVAHATDNDLFRALAFTGFFLNLFNLIPLVPFDGGRAMAAMAPWMWFVGFAGMLAFFAFFPSPFLIIFLLLGGMETWRRWKQRHAEEGNESYYRVPPAQRLMVGAVYVGLIAILAVGMDLTFIDRTAHF
jgi:Zn-dependent protease